MWASMRGAEDIARLLLAHGAEVNAKMQDGMTALDYAIRDKRGNFQELLRKVGGKLGKQC